MSIIFETLQKLNRSTVATDTEETAARPRRNTYALKSVLLSPVTVLLLSAMVFGLGYGLVFGLRHLQRQARLDPAVVAAAETPAIAVAAPGVVNPETEEVPPPPDIRHLEGAPEAVVTGPAVDEAVSAVPLATAEAAFIDPDIPPPSEAQMRALPNETPTFSPAGSWNSPLESVNQAPPVADSMGFMQAGDNVAAGQFSPPDSPPLVPQADDAALSTGTGGLVQPFGQDSGETFYQALPDPAETAMPSARAAANGVQYAAVNAAATTAENWRSSTAATFPAVTARRPGTSSAATPTPAGADAKALRPVKRVAIPRYTELVKRLQAAVTNGDTQSTEKLLDDFAAVKGKEHPYLLKLKAYQYLQAKDFAAAERLLNQVLALDQTDRDANLNLVVVEAQTGRIDAARRRVARLAELYPEDETLAAMGRRLN
jgi:hypothetical protein